MKTKLIFWIQTFILTRIGIYLLWVINNLFNNLREIFSSKDTEEAVFMSIINNINAEHEP
jgi:hypothetical protein